MVHFHSLCYNITQEKVGGGVDGWRREALYKGQVAEHRWHPEMLTDTRYKVSRNLLQRRQQLEGQEVEHFKVRG